MKKRFLALFLAIALICALLPATLLTANAETYSGTCGENLTWTFDSETGTLTVSGSGDMYDSEFGWYQYRNAILQVVLQEGLTNISRYAFAGYPALTSISIPDSVTAIPDYAFNGCAALENVSIGSGVQTIGSDAFRNTAIYNDDAAWQDDLLYIGNWLIKARTSITSASLRPSTVGMADDAFYNCTALTNVTLPNGLQTIADSAFYNCTALTNVTFSSGLQTIADSAFRECTALTNVTLPNGLQTIADSAFRGCAALESIAIPESVTSIGEYAFCDCRALTNVTIPSGVTEISKGLFAGCSALESVTLPNGLTIIGSFAFSYCTMLVEIVIPETVTSIEDAAFYQCSKLLSVSVPAGVTEINAHTFFNCNALKTVSLPDGITFIGESAFYATSIESMDLPSAVETIDNTAFDGCGNLASVTIPAELKSVGVSAFGDCSGLSAVYISDLAAWCGIEFINADANPLYSAHTLYLNGQPLRNMSIPEGVPEITPYAFYNCTSLRSVTIPDSVTKIGNQAFCGCNKITKLTIPESVVTCGRYVFTGCAGLKTAGPVGGGYHLEFGWTQNIPAYAFYGMDGLTEVTLPYGITDIGREAFYGNPELASNVIIPGTVQNISQNVFESCNKLPGVMILNPLCAINSSRYTLGNPAKTVIYGFADSIAQDYAEDNGYTFVTLEWTEPTYLWAEDDSSVTATHTLIGYETITESETVQTVYEFTETPSCESPGVGTVTATFENPSFETQSKPVTVEALGHDLVEHAAQAPTCTEIGWNAYTGCSRCDYSIDYVEIPALGHDLTDHAEKAPTCTENGWNAYQTCSRCDYSTYEAIAALGHDLVTDAAVAPTCTATGLTAGEHCTRCDYKVAQETVPALGHSWNDGEITTPATETEDGVKTFTCTVCGVTKTEIIPATGEEACKHEHSHADHKDATCTEDGYDKLICDDCGKVLSEAVIPALGHDIVADAAVPATCTATGLTAGEHCTRCDYKIAQETVPMLAHSYKDGVCTRCGAKDPNYKPVEPTKFNDVKENAWYYDAVNYAVQNDLMNGVGNGNFAPDSPMTRAMLVTVLWRYEGSPQEGRNIFTDVSGGQWYTDAVAWAAHNGIVGGVGNGKFNPNGNITREQMAAILFRYAEKKGFDTSKRGDLSGFPDAGKVSSWATDAIAWAVAEKLITGNDGRLDPQGNATRAQVSTILMRFIENIAKK